MTQYLTGKTIKAYADIGWHTSCAQYTTDESHEYSVPLSCCQWSGFFQMFEKAEHPWL